MQQRPTKAWANDSRTRLHAPESIRQLRIRSTTVEYGTGIEEREGPSSRWTVQAAASGVGPHWSVMPSWYYPRPRPAVTRGSWDPVLAFGVQCAPQPRDPVPARRVHRVPASSGPRPASVPSPSLANSLHCTDTRAIWGTRGRGRHAGHLAGADPHCRRGPRRGRSTVRADSRVPREPSAFSHLL